MRMGFLSRCEHCFHASAESNYWFIFGTHIQSPMVVKSAFEQGLENDHGMEMEG